MGVGLDKLGARVLAEIGGIEKRAAKLTGQVISQPEEFAGLDGELKIKQAGEEAKAYLLLLATLWNGAKESRQIMDRYLHQVDALV